MLPVLFEVDGFRLYGYGLMIALGCVAGVAYMATQGKRDVKLTFDQANYLFLWIFLAAVVGGKIFLILEDPSFYANNPRAIISGSGFVFYGSFLLAVPTMLLFFRRHKLDKYRMLDVMAITTCLVHIFGRIGCFLAGCCYGRPTNSFAGVTFTHELSAASPRLTPLHPSQLYEAGFIGLTLIFLLVLRSRRKFYGQMFLTYLLFYAIGRFGLEFFRGDTERGLLFDGLFSHAQLTAVMILLVALYFYWRWSKSQPMPQGVTVARK